MRLIHTTLYVNAYPTCGSYQVLSTLLAGFMHQLQQWHANGCTGPSLLNPNTQPPPTRPRLNSSSAGVRTVYDQLTQNDPALIRAGMPFPESMQHKVHVVLITPELHCCLYICLCSKTHLIKCCCHVWLLPSMAAVLKSSASHDKDCCCGAGLYLGSLRSLSLVEKLQITHILVSFWWQSLLSARTLLPKPAMWLTCSHGAHIMTIYILLCMCISYSIGCIHMVHNDMAAVLAPLCPSLCSTVMFQCHACDCRLHVS